MGVRYMSGVSLLDTLLVLMSNTASSNREFEAGDGLNETRFQLKAIYMSDI